MSYDAGSIEATLDVGLSPFRQGLETAKREAREFEKQKIAPVVDLDDRRAKPKIDSIEAQLRRVAQTKATATVAVESGQALRKLIDTSDRLDRLRKEVATARVAADTDDAKRRLDALDIQLRRIGMITSRPRVTVDGVERANLQLDGLALRLAAVSGGGGAGRGVPGVGAGGRGGGLGGFVRGLPNPSWLALGIGAAAPLVPGAVGLGLGAGASLLTPAAAGLLGLGGFGAAAKSSITTVDKDTQRLTALTQRYNAAVTDKQRAAVLKQEAALWASMDPAQRHAVQNVQALDSAWKTFQKRLEPQTFGALAGGATLARTGLGRLFPSSQAAGNAVVGLEKTTNQGLNSGFSQQFFGQFLPGETSRAIDSGGVALQNVVAGLGHLIEKFAPLGHDFEGFLVRTSARFEKWSEGSGPSKFVTWVEREGPPAVKALEGLAHGLEGVGKGLAPIARVELAALTPTLNFLGKLGDEHPEVITAVGAALLTLGAGLKVVKGVGAVGSILGKIPGLGGGGGGGGVAGRVLGVAGAPGSSPAHPAYVVVLDPGGAGGLPVPAGKKPGPISRVLKKVPLPLTATLTGAYIATQGGDQSPGQGSLVSTEGVVGQHSRANVSAAYLNQIIGSLPASARKGVVTDNGSFRELNTQKAVNAIETSGTSDQKAALVELAKRYSNVAAAVKKYQQQVRDTNASLRTLNTFLVKNTGLAQANAKQHQADVATVLGTLGKIPGALAQAEAQAKRGGTSIGAALDAGLTIGIKQNGGKVNFVTKQLIDGVLHTAKNTAQIGSPSKVTTGYGRDIAAGLAVGFAGEMPQVQALFAKNTAAALHSILAVTGSRLGSARQQLSADVSSRSQYAAGLAGQIVGGLNLSGAVGPTGNVGNLSAYLGNYAKSEHTLATDLSRLRAKHLSPGLLQMIAEAGPQQGAALAASILSGQSGSVAHVNAMYKSVGTYAGQIGGTTAAALYGPTVARDQQMVAALQAILAELKKNPKAVASALDAAIRLGKVHR